ncbi:glycerol kinase GlpK [Spiroplasma endosymbiont of Nebria brevicollis]|uniref:glycerol kinase GlpK n=1 Tax=Spiroplasma endosymbiont of Nebria brevicollis TaxID=3066284 RepID=UPI00313E1123
MVKTKYIMTLDEGTSSCRTLIINQKGQIIGSHQIEIPQHYPPQSGWVEHDPIGIWNNQLTTMVQALNKSGISPNQIAAIGITNQRETTVVWNLETGLPIYNAIVWQDRRTANYCDELTKKGWKDKIHQKTGLLIDAYFSGTKIKWILDNVKGGRELAKNGKLAFGTIDSWLIYKMTVGTHNNQVQAKHVIDITNASRTMLFNINTKQWDKELLELFDIPEIMLPEVVPSSGEIGKTYKGMLSKNDDTEIMIAAAIGDQQAALFGQLCLKAGEVKNTYGTGCFILMNIGNKPLLSKQGLLTTVAYQLTGQKPVYALEGSVFVAGAAVQFLRDQLRILYRSDESLWYSQIVDPKDEQRVYVVPAFVGLGAPYWDSTARGAIFGLERGTKREHIVKATIESLAYQSQNMIMAMQEDINLNKDLKNLTIKIKVDGGASNNPYIMQFQSDISRTTLIKPQNTETTAMGAAYLAGLAVGFWKNIDEIKKIYVVEKEYSPVMKPEDAKILYKGWQEAVKRTRGWTTAIK